MLTSSPSRSLRSDGLATDTVAASQAAKVIATPILMSIITLVFCAQIVLSHFGVDLIALGGGSFVRFAAGEWWRIVTPVVLHNSALQVLVCLFGLLVTGPTLERTIGTLPFCCVCVGGAVGSSLAHFQFFGSTVLLGAAGAFWAIVGGTLALTVVRGIPIHAPQHLLLQAMSTPLCLFSLTVSYSLISIINHDAYAISHAGGFVSGFVTILVAPFGARQVRTFEAMGAVTVVMRRPVPG
jgi:membrane associated rhomboid family serine protease